MHRLRNLDATAEHGQHGPGTGSPLALDDSGNSLYYDHNTISNELTKVVLRP